MESVLRPFHWLLSLSLAVAALYSPARSQCPPAGEPSQYKATVKIGSGSARPGGTVDLPFTINGNSEVQGVSFSVDFDERLLEVIEIEQVVHLPPEIDDSFVKLAFNNSDDQPGGDGFDEGYLWGALVFRAKEGMWPDRTTWKSLLPPGGADNTMFILHLRVKPTAPLGETFLLIKDGAPTPHPSPPIQNVVTLEGCSANLLFQVGPLFVHGVLGIVDDVSLFVRGESNSDYSIDLSDAVFTLSYLFLAGPAPACPDAADANDDGRLDISDPVRILGSLFLGGGLLPPPHSSRGRDPTDDDLSC